jgi:hypothetical protein
MNTDRPDELAVAYEAVARKEKLTAMRAHMEGDRERLTQKLDTLKAALAKEEKDVDRLENAGITALFWSALGRRDERIDKEREEALAARLKYDQATKELQDLDSRIGAAEKELKDLDGCEECYVRLFEEKKRRLVDEHGPAGQRLSALAEEMGRSQANLKEIQEASNAGNRVLAWLDSALESLRKAENWGTYDMLGGGLMAGMVKHDHMDHAAECVSGAQMAMNEFRSELADIDLRCDISVGIGDFARFADLFFDGLFSDWYVQGAIEDSLNSVSAARGNVTSARFKLDGLYRNEQNHLTQLKTELEALVVGG